MCETDNQYSKFKNKVSKTDEIKKEYEEEDVEMYVNSCYPIFFYFYRKLTTWVPG
ncbi:MAG: hypothetical protein HY958_10440 [Bacteroidia bacterium]|nr:hypothetical protein [Bacteroidia bacterium]